MSDPKDDASDRYEENGKLHHAVRTMPRWKKILLVMSLLVGVAGFGVQEASSYMRKSAPPTPTPAVTGRPAPSGGVMPGGSSGFVGGGSPASPAPDSSTSTTSSPQTQAPSVSDKMTPYVTRIGFSVFIGAVVGFIFRTFIKLAAGITALIVAIAIGLSYFHILNVDMTAVKTETANASGWLSDQAGRLKEVIFSALPSSTGAGAGFVFGFKRR
jgi:uncharacterized membrane protein (Fun14 family)